MAISQQLSATVSFQLLPAIGFDGRFCRTDRLVVNSQNEFRLSVLEADILVAIDHVGWYAYLWFPIVQREVLNFGTKEPDEAVHVAFASLIRKGALVVTQENPGDIPRWAPSAGALEIARETLVVGRDLRSPTQ